jgi:hypothetical protein
MKERFLLRIHHFFMPARTSVEPAPTPRLVPPYRDVVPRAGYHLVKGGGNENHMFNG